MTQLIQFLLWVFVAAGVAVMVEPHQHRYSASQNDILSGLTWATLDLAHLGQPGHLDLEGLNLTLPDLYNNTLASRRPRVRKLMKRTAADPIAIEIEYKYTVPLFTVYESDNVYLEIPIATDVELPKLIEFSNTEQCNYDGRLNTVLTDFEGLLSMLGLDGNGCVRKALCEVAAMPSIVPEGLVGEMLQLFAKHLTQEGEARKLDEADLVLGESETREEEEEQTEEPEMEKQNDGNKEETKEHEEKSGKQKEPVKIKTGKERSRRRRPRKIDEYVAAGNHGRQNGDCWAAFPECPLSLLHLNNLA